MKRLAVLILLGWAFAPGSSLFSLPEASFFPVSAASPPDILTFVSTLAGSGLPGMEDGTIHSARFRRPTGVASDRSGNRFIVDSGNHLIRRIDRFGMVTTFAGRGAAGFSDGIGRVAMFNEPKAIAIDRNGNLFVSDAGNFRIRKIAPNGQVTTIAGSGREGNNEGPAGEAEFVEPAGVAVDRSGAVYVADRGAHRIKRISPDRIVMIAAGTGEPGNENGTAVLAKLHNPAGIAFDDVDNLYIADAGSHTIRRIDPSGVVMNVAGSGLPGYRDGLREQAQFFEPTGVAVDREGNLIVTDSKDHRIRKIRLPEGRVTTLAGAGRAGDLNGLSGSAEFNSPVGIEVDPSGRIVIADSANHRLREVDPRVLRVKVPEGRALE
ncbi:MAG TPA: NHL repeat-containing protein [Candidatus Manganitrophaceae bacterium]|nr:NHL repeat-containing protein [Candidatus Manganitrophaceae bacterium]